VSRWRAEVLIPAHRIVVALRGDDVIELRADDGPSTFRVYRALPDAVHGMIAWPNTVLVTGDEPIIIDPGYQTQGDMLVAALAMRGLAPGDVRTVVMTHLHSDHIAAVPQLGPVSLYVHAEELATPYGRRQHGWLDEADVRTLEGERGEVLPGISWLHTPGHSPGHIAVVVETDDGRVVVAGDTMGPEPAWFADRNPPAGLEHREQHIAAYDKIAALDPALIIPGHYGPIQRGTT
jgi:glyoxylase-like metal-dependent hydrolase (beta-lactamase superfamily II)